MKPYSIVKIPEAGFFLSRGDQAISLTCAEAQQICTFITKELAKKLEKDE